MRKELLFPNCFSFRFRYTLICPFFPFLPKFFNVVNQLTNMVTSGKTNSLSAPKIKALRKYPIFGSMVVLWRKYFFASCSVVLWRKYSLASCQVVLWRAVAARLVPPHRRGTRGEWDGGLYFLLLFPHNSKVWHNTEGFLLSLN